jgi:hypothetical protein
MYARCRFIDKDDLLQFVSEEEVAHVLALFDAAVELEKITAQALKNWTVCKLFLQMIRFLSLQCSLSIDGSQESEANFLFFY